MGSRKGDVDEGKGGGAGLNLGNIFKKHLFFPCTIIKTLRYAICFTVCMYHNLFNTTLDLDRLLSVFPIKTKQTKKPKTPKLCSEYLFASFLTAGIFD